MKVAILYRMPESSGKDYPLDSQGRDEAKHVQKIKEAIAGLGHLVQLVDVNLDSYELLRRGNFDLAFNLCDDGFRNDSLLEAHVPAILDILQIPYTGSTYFTLATCIDKARTKEILAFHNICTAEFQVFYHAQQKLSSKLRFPLIVKPLHEDASIGIRNESVVENVEQLRERITFNIKNYEQPAIVENFISGREVYVGILGSKDNLTVLPISEIIFDSQVNQTAKICSYEAKWIPETDDFKDTPVKCPAIVSADLKQKLVDMATQAYNLLGCRDYARIDFRIDAKNQPHVLEVNPNPDISDDAGLATMARTKGISYEKLIARILGFALQRTQGYCAAFAAQSG